MTHDNVTYSDYNADHSPFLFSCTCFILYADRRERLSAHFFPPLPVQKVIPIRSWLDGHQILKLRFILPFYLPPLKISKH